MKKVIALTSLVALATSCGSAPTPNPSLTLTAPHNTVITSGKFRLTATPSNIASISKVEFFDGDTKLGEDASAPYHFDVVLTSSNNGTKNYKATARSSNAATSSAVSAVNVNIVAGFVMVGSQLNTTANDYVDLGSRSLAVDANDVPYMIFTEAKSKVVVKKWLANAWQQVGEVLSEVGDPGGISLDSNGNPVVIFSEYKADTDSDVVYVRKWTGSAWQQLGGSLMLDPTISSGTKQIALDSSNNPVVVWNEYKGNHNLYAKKWNGSAWQQLGGALDIDLTQSASNPSLAMTPDGAAVVAWQEFDGVTYKIHAKKWDGNMWQKLGGVLNVKPTSAAYTPAVALDSSGNPIVAWTETVATSNIFVKKWDGAMWQQVGNTTLNMDTTKSGSLPDIQFDATGAPVVVWKETLASGSGIFAKKWTGSTWQQIGSSPLNSNPAQETNRPALALDSQNNPFVGWVQAGTTLYNVHVTHLNQ
jgi:hypothetical protein